MDRNITQKELEKFREYLYEEEKSSATIQKYMRDVKKLFNYAKGQKLEKKTIIEYKEMLKNSGNYQLSSINSFLAAANCFLNLWDGTI